MTPNENNKERANIAKELFSKAQSVEDLRQVCKDMPHMCLNEKSILYGMIKANSIHSYKQGFLNIPRTTRLLFHHAVQSYIFNLLISYRMKLGTDIIEGDLIKVSKEKHKTLIEGN